MKAGTYEGKIVNHGTDITGSGLPFIWFDVDVDDPEAPGYPVQGRFKLFLGGKSDEKTATAIRMARAGLKLCGFDPDTQGIDVLDTDPTLLMGNVVPIKCSQNEYQGKVYDNFDLVIHKGGLPPDRAASLTNALRSAKTKDEAPAAPPRRGSDPNPPKLPPSSGGGGSGYASRPASPSKPAQTFDDIPF